MINSEKILNKVISNSKIIDAKNIPGIDMYMDQVTTFMDKYLKNNKRFEDDKILTKTMINNYAKNDLLPPPVKKRYSKQHVIMLIFIYYLKSILSINDIKTLLAPVSEKYFDTEEELSIDDIYDEVSSLETTLKDSIKEDITDKIALSKEFFPDVPKEDQEFLQLFILVNALSYDVYIKKQMIETIVDAMNTVSGKSEKAEKKEAKKTEKSKAEKSKAEKNKTDKNKSNTSSDQ